MAERSFSKEVQKLRLGNGQRFFGEGILAITKALLQNGVGYVGGYQGAPISHLMDVLADAQDILKELGIHFESSASESAATAMLAASVNYPIRGAVTFKSTVGTNVASDALANLASGGVTGGALIIVGEDYGEGSSIMQERSHAFAMKSQVWLLDPRPDIPSMVKAVKDGFELSEATNTPVMLLLRIRCCHVTGSFTASDNLAPPFTVAQALQHPKRDLSKIVLPPASFSHEQAKIEQRWPAAENFIVQNQLNEHYGSNTSSVGIILQGGLYNAVLRALARLSLADIYGQTDIAILCLNVAYPLVETQVVEFCQDKKAVLIVEEGQPNYIEQNIGYMLHQAGKRTTLCGKGYLPAAGEYTASKLIEGVGAFIKSFAPELLPEAVRSPNEQPQSISTSRLHNQVPARPPSFCIGCPERPIFAATRLLMDELGEHHIASDIGCHLFSIMPPFNLGSTTMGYGLGPASASALRNDVQSTAENSSFRKSKNEKRSISFIGDGGFWHNGLNSSIGNAVYNKNDGVIVVVDNFYSAATGGQDILSSRATKKNRQTNNPIVKAAKGVGVKWVRQIDRTYDVSKVRNTLKAALTSQTEGPKVIVASSECMLNRQRREKPIFNQLLEEGKRVAKPRFGVDAEVCTGDHACIRLSGCPSLTIRDSQDPLRDDPIASIDHNCVGCGNCGEVAEDAVLCPSFYQVQVVSNPGRLERFLARWSLKLIGFLQNRRDQRRAMYTGPAQ